MSTAYLLGVTGCQAKRKSASLTANGEDREYRREKFGIINTGALVVKHNLETCHATQLICGMMFSLNINACIMVQMMEGPSSNLCIDTTDTRKNEGYTFTNFQLVDTSYQSIVLESLKQHRTSLILCANTGVPF